jgi:hypothetical protein
MKPCYRVVPLGGCPLNIPLGILRAQGKISSAFLEAGFKRWPLSLSPSGAIQLLNYGLGRIGIPQELRSVCYQDPTDEPRVDSSPLFHSADVMLLEFSTPIDIVMDGFILNQNHLREYTTECASRFSDEAKRLVKIWNSHGLGKQNEVIRAECSEGIMKEIGKSSDSTYLFRNFIQNCRSRALDENEMMTKIEYIIDIFNIPTILIFHNFSYMPDGRATSWPQNFKRNIQNIASDLKIVAYDPANIVAQHGVKIAMADDYRHYKDSFNATIADQYLKMINEQF